MGQSNDLATPHPVLEAAVITSHISLRSLSGVVPNLLTATDSQDIADGLSENQVLEAAFSRAIEVKLSRKVGQLQRD